MARKRADILLVEKGLCESRSQAARLILAGLVRVGADHLVAKSSELVAGDAPLAVAEPYPYVSRGAEKLLGGLEAFPWPLHGLTVLDIGASTGGFTDLLLQHGVARVYAVDVGYGQLHAKLRNDPRVVSLERTNARQLSAREIPEPVDLLVGDVSFISLTKILPACARLMKEHARAYLLVKPQFEARREDVGKGGVVRDPEIRRRCLETVCQFACRELGWRLVGTAPSPLKGPKGNQETVAVFETATATPPDAAGPGH